MLVRRFGLYSPSECHKTQHFNRFYSQFVFAPPHVAGRLRLVRLLSALSSDPRARRTESIRKTSSAITSRGSFVALRLFIETREARCQSSAFHAAPLSILAAAVAVLSMKRSICISRIIKAPLSKV